nr:hypothetical protein [uncultured bacterium]
MATGHARKAPAGSVIGGGCTIDLFAPEPPRLPTEQEIDEWMAQLPF